MQTGPTHSEKITIEALPPEMLDHIVSFVPAYQFFGNNKLSMVSKQVKQAAFNNAKRKMTPRAVLESCKTEEDALFILKDKEYMCLFSFKEILMLVSKSETLSNQLLNANAIIKFSKEELLLLGDTHSSIMERILIDFPEMLWNSSTRMQFSGRHLSIANRVFDELSENQNRAVLAKLGSYNFEIADRIYRDKTLFDSMVYDDLLKLSRAHPGIAQSMIDNPNYKADLKKYDTLEQVAGYHCAIAQKVLDNYLAFPDSLPSSQALKFLGQCHSTIAEQIVNNPKFLEQLTRQAKAAVIRSHLSRLGTRHPTIAHWILDRPELYRDWSIAEWAELGLSSAGVAKRIMLSDEATNKKFRDQVIEIEIEDKSLSWFLEILARSYFDSTVMKKLLNDKFFCDPSRNDPKPLITASREYPGIAFWILNNENVKSAFEEEDLKEIKGYTVICDEINKHAIIRLSSLAEAPECSVEAQKEADVLSLSESLSKKMKVL